MVVIFGVTELPQGRPPRVDRRIVPGAGHFLPRENPQAFAAAMLDSLQG